MFFKNPLLNKSIHLGSVLLLFFCYFSSAKLSDEQKIKFIERIAKKFPKTRTFYRWQSETARTNMLQAGEFTSTLYAYFMGMEPDPLRLRAGVGVYVSDDIASSSAFGLKLMKVEVEKGAPYLDLSKLGVKFNLRTNGISNEDVYRLNPKIAIKYENVTGGGWWVLKGAEGVKFKAIDVREMSVPELRDILSPVFKVKYYQIKREKAIKRIIFNFLENAPSTEDKIKVLSAIKPPNKNLDDFLQKNRVPQLAGEVKNYVINRSKNIRNVTSLLSADSSIFSAQDKARARNNLLSSDIRTALLNIHNAKKSNEKNKIIRDAFQHITSGIDGLALLHHTDKSSLRQKIIQTSIPKMKTVGSAAELLLHTNSSSLRNKILQASIPHIKSGQDGAWLIRSMRGNPLRLRSNISKIVKATLPHIRSGRDGVALLKSRRLSASNRTQILNTSIAHLQTVDDGLALLPYANRFQKKKIINNLVPHTTSIKGAVRVITSINFRPSSTVKKIIDTALPHMNSAVDGVQLLKMKKISSADKKRIFNTMLSHIESETSAKNLLQSMKDIASKSDIHRIIGAVLPHIKSLKKIEEILNIPGVIISKKDINKMIEVGIQENSHPHAIQEFLHSVKDKFSSTEISRIVDRALPKLQSYARYSIAVNSIMELLGDQQLPLSKKDRRKIWSSMVETLPDLAHSSDLEKIKGKLTTADQLLDFAKSNSSVISRADQKKLLNNIIPVLSYHSTPEKIDDIKHLKPKERKFISNRVETALCLKTELGVP